MDTNIECLCCRNTLVEAVAVEYFKLLGDERHMQSLKERK